jgi:hypothetical protein
LDDFLNISGHPAGNRTGLPDLSSNKIPKWEKFTKSSQNIPNGHKILLMEANYTNIFHSNAHHKLPKF